MAAKLSAKVRSERVQEELTKMTEVIMRYVLIDEESMTQEARDALGQKMGEELIKMLVDMPCPQLYDMQTFTTVIGDIVNVAIQHRAVDSLFNRHDHNQCRAMDAVYASMDELDEQL